jgi:hypothetical protein
MQMEGSTIARLRETIAQEYQAAHRGLHGLAAVGKVPHLYRTQCTERIEEARKKLVELVGPDEATRIFIETLDAQDPVSGGTAPGVPNP